MSPLHSLSSKLDKALTLVMQLLLCAITLVVSWQVLSRYGFGAPSSITEELSRFLLIWLTLLGCPYAYRRHGHLGLDLLYEKAQGIEKTLLWRSIHSLVAFVAITIFIIGGFALVKLTAELEQYSPIMGIAMSQLYLVVPLAGFILLIYALDFCSKRAA